MSVILGAPSPHSDPNQFGLVADQPSSWREPAIAAGRCSGAPTLGSIGVIHSDLRRCATAPGRSWLDQGRAGTERTMTGTHILKKRQKRLTGVDEMVISLAAKGLTTGEVQAHLAEVYGAEVSRRTISTITDKVLEGMAEWQSPPTRCRLSGGLHRRHPRQDPRRCRRQPARLCGPRGHCRGPAGDPGALGGEGAKHWLHILTEIKNRGVNDVLMLVCDGLKGLPEAVETVWPRTIVQTCVVHLLRNSFRYAARQDWTRSPASSSRSTPHRPRRPPLSGSPSSPMHGAGSTRRS